MKLVILKTYDDICDFAYSKISSLIDHFKNKKLILGLPTGSTPTGVYRRIVSQKLDFSNVVTFNMDEYVGLNKNHKNSFYYFMEQNLFKKINILKENINIPDGSALDLNAECLRYEKKIKQEGGIDLFMGGIGRNGHIAINEPNTLFNTRTWVNNLSRDTISANSRFFKSKEEVPKQAITIGIATILEARELLFLASGKEKATAIKELIQGDISEKCPVSAIKLHEKVTLVIDEDAASNLG